MEIQRVERQGTGPALFDIHIARFLLRRSGLKGEDAVVFSALIQRLSAALGDGHSCTRLLEEEREVTSKLPACFCLSLKSYLAGDRAPLVVHDNKVFFYRYFHYEFRLARQIETLASGHQEMSNLPLLATLFPEEEGEAGPDLQKEAALRAVTSNFTIISGGPGTGKTTTVVKILALLFARSLAEGTPLPRIALAAPTGRAAMRLGEAIAGSIDRLALPEAIQNAIPRTAFTLHRLLGVRRSMAGFLHDHSHPLEYSVVVVDEASMVDLALMSRLVDALPPGCRFLLLGDKDQLASVESGAVLADLLAGLPACGVQLKRSYRFDENIGALAAAVNAGDSLTAWQLLEDPDRQNLALLSSGWRDWLAERLAVYMTAAQEVVADSGPLESAILPLFPLLRSFQLLCVTRKGPRGVERINAEIVRLLAAMGFPCRGGDAWYPGRPVMVTSNAYRPDLFNGDIGICMPTAEGEQRIWFERAEEGGVIGLLPGQLPGCDTAFALTIHKSQGSEFAEVAVLLPENISRGLSRELLYTGITRARKGVWVLADREVFAAALASRISRQSGLRQLLGGEDALPA